MNFDLNEDQKLLKEMIRNFSQNEIAPVAKALEENHEFPHQLISKLAELGVLGMSVPSEYGGCKTDYVSLMIVLEELSRSLPSLSVIVSVHCSLFCYAILKFGTSNQKSTYLPKAARGEIIGAFSLTEPGAGSDATNLKTKAMRQGDFYVLNGTKSWVTSGNNAGAIIIFAINEVKNGKNQTSAFIVDKDTPGLHISKTEEKMGLHSSITVEISLEDCKIPASNLLGKEGQGMPIAFQCLECSRTGIAAQSTGLCQRAVEEAIKYAIQREAFGKKIADFQGIQFMLADMATMTEAARLMTYKAADLCDKNQPFGKEASMAKLFASEAANKVASQALQIHGAYGYSKEFFIEQLYRDARVLPIYEGTSEVQKIIISRHLLRD